MSHRLIARSNDLLRLRNDGFNIEVRNGYLLIKDVPYVDDAGIVHEDGVLISELELEVRDGQQVTRRPNDHVARWDRKASLSREWPKNP
ncbi:hypothetical protein SAMN05216573_10519 [Bradyrhizobium sp. Rc3b]|uniref:DUF6791 domain-containing protein n=1 Tax=Bradyrhizobium sp. Rc3b TaxID=1855322 RepID=UPI0008E0CE1D|nr:hypothetical protein SAMN05216573_10519 [Bradyrhizobium sp. Rc3b]